MPNPPVRDSYDVKNGVDERSDEGVLRWFNHNERMEDGRIDKKQ